MEMVFTHVRHGVLPLLQLQFSPLAHPCGAVWCCGGHDINPLEPRGVFKNWMLLLDFCK